MNFFTKTTVILAFWLIMKFCTCELPSYSCEKSSPDHCVVIRVVTTKDKPSFLLTPENPDEVERFMIFNSVIPILTGDSCKVFPILNTIRTINCSIKSLDIETFAPCSNLTQLWLQNEKISRLDPGMFRHLTNLEELFIIQTTINFIDSEAFVGLDNLKVLILAETQQNFIDPEIFKPLRSLTGLSLQGNNLIDLNVEGLLEVLPLLKTFSFDDNDIPCQRTKEIITTLKNANIEPPRQGELKFKPRSYPIARVFGTICIPDGSINYETTTDYVTKEMEQEEKHEKSDTGCVDKSKVKKMSDQVNELGDTIKRTVAKSEIVKKRIDQALAKLEHVNQNVNQGNQDSQMMEFYQQQVLTNSVLMEMQLVIFKYHGEKLDQITNEIALIKEIVKKSDV